MNETLLEILVPIVFALFVFGVGRVVAALFKGDRKRLKHRLETDANANPLAQLPHSIRLRMNSGGISGHLVKYRAMAALDRRLQQASPGAVLSKFLGTSLGLALCACVIATLVSGSGLIGLIAATIGGAIPFWLIAQQRQRRIKKVTEQLPEALDFMTRVLRAGHGLSTAIRMMGEELPQPLAGEFRRCYDQHSLGQPLDLCLKEMTNSVQSTDFAFFVTAVLIQRQTGGDLSQVLSNISGMVRQRVRLLSHVKAKTAEGRFTGYILVAFPMVMFFLAYFMNPSYAGVLLHTSTGLWLLGTAFTLEMLGLFAIRKITTIRV